MAYCFHNLQPYNNIHQVFIDSKNRTLIATTCSEIHFINGKGEVARLENSKIYPINDIVAFYEDSNYRIWASTLGNGIWMIDKEENVNYNKSSGLISNYCYSISSSEKGEILIGHRGGLSQLNPETGHIKIFGHSEGIKTSTDFYTNSNYSDSHGNSWFGTSQGLLKYSPGIYLGGTMEPRLKITGLFLDGKELDWTGGKITLKPGQYEIKVEYIGINLTNPALVRYQTYLEGYSKNWSDLTLKRSVIYDRVDYGNYLFKIKAFNENNIGGEISSFFEVSIKKPVYLSVWFYAILAILIGSGFYTLLKWRERNLKRVQERLIKNLDEKTKDIIVKEEIIKERKKVEKELIEAKTKVELSDKLKTSFLNNMSHEIRTPMNAIVGFSQILMNVGGTEAEQKEYLDKINQNAESLLTLIDDIIDLSRLETGQLNINNDSCNPNALILELQAKYQEILDNQGKNKIQLTTDIPGKTDLNITTDTTRLNQIMTKLLDNAVKFTEAGSIRF